MVSCAFPVTFWLGGEFLKAGTHWPNSTDVYSSLSNTCRPNVRLLLNGHVGKPPADRQPISAWSQWLECGSIGPGHSRIVLQNIRDIPVYTTGVLDWFWTSLPASTGWLGPNCYCLFTMCIFFWGEIMSYVFIVHPLYLGAELLVETANSFPTHIVIILGILASPSSVLPLVLVYLFSYIVWSDYCGIKTSQWTLVEARHWHSIVSK